MPKDNKIKMSLEPVPDTETEVKIKKMMDPSVPDEVSVPDPNVFGIVPENNPGTAPEVVDLPKPKEPLKIKILKSDSDDATSKSSDSQRDSLAEPQEDPESREEIEAPNDLEDKKSIVEKQEEDFLPPVIEDPETNAAVEDIVVQESDALLAAEDEKIAEAFRLKDEKKVKQQNLLKRWWLNKKIRNMTFAAVGFLIILMASIPTSRYFVLNNIGVRSSASVHVLDQSTQLPLKNVEVLIGGVGAKTDTEGNAKLNNLRLGKAELVVQKRAFAAEKSNITVGWGSNPFGDFKLKPTGTQYAFALKDYLSKKPIQNAEATSGEASALSDKDGKILLTMENPKDDFEVAISADSYRTEILKISADSKKSVPVTMVPNRPHVFISKRSGKYDVYKIDIDGKNEKLILAGTGYERQDMMLVPNPGSKTVALVSTRDGKSNKDGFLLSDLNIIDLEDDSTTKVASSEKIQIVGWAKDKLVYVQIEQGASAANPKRHRLMSYDYEQSKNIEIAASNYFNDVMMVSGKIYFAPSGLYQKGVPLGLFKVEADGSKKETLLSKETWNIFRTSYGHISVSLPKAWYDYDISKTTLSPLKNEPANIGNRVYVDNQENTLSAWVDQRDGKGVLLVYDIKSGADKLLQTRSGLVNPIFWINNSTILFRVNTDQETADYAISTDGGEPRKIQDVTNTSGIDKWYYY